MPKKRRTVGGKPAHTSVTRQRKTNRDHACLVRFHGEETSPERIRKRQQRPMMEDEVIAAQLSNLVTPALIAQEKSYRQLGMRDRILNLPSSSRVTRDELMVAAVLTLIWRDVAGVTELTRILARAGFLLIIDPFPDLASREGSFFFEPSAQTCLTTALVP